MRSQPAGLDRSPRAARLCTVGWIAALATLLSCTAHAEAKFRTGLYAGEFTSPTASVRQTWLDRAVDAGAGVVRFDAVWSQIATAVPADATDPADPAYDFEALDAGIQDATARGLVPMLTIYNAPTFAEGPNRPASATPGSWKPDPQAFEAFATALATRYSGSYAGLPAVRHYETWNEANLDLYLAPQYQGSKQVSASRYRELVNAMYDAANAVHPANKVIAGSLAPYGDPRGGKRTRPLAFLRKFLCLKRSLKAIQCPVKPRFDLASHHPINLSGGPRRSAIDPDDASTPDLKHVGELIRAAERRHTVVPAGGHRELWATEIWWESDPPEGFGVPLRTQARYIEEALYVLWKQGAKVVVNYPFHDVPEVGLQSGLYFLDGPAKPSLTAFRFPFVTERATEDRVTAWGIAPAAGEVRIQRRGSGGWRTIDSTSAAERQVFSLRLRLREPAKLRAQVNGEKSLVWSQR